MRQPGTTQLGPGRRRLPHFAREETAQFVTFRLADSLPAEQLDLLREGFAALSDTRADSERRRRIEGILDAGGGACRLKDVRIAALVQDALLYFDGERYALHAWVIMPNHVHALLTSRPGSGLSDIIGSWKSYTARRANSLLSSSGPFWQTDYFDRGIRDERQFYAVWSYIESNPTRVGLCVQDNEWQWSSAYRAANLEGSPG